MGSQKEENGTPARNVVSMWDVWIPSIPACKRNIEIVGENERERTANNPKGRVQKQRKGVTNRVVSGPSKEILLKWSKAKGAVARKAAHEIKSPEMMKNFSVCTMERLSFLGRHAARCGMARIIAAVAAKESWKEAVWMLRVFRRRMQKAAMARLFKLDH